MGQIINIPKNTIIKAVMGDTEYKVSNKRNAFDEPRRKVRYYNTAGRLTRAQILVLLELHKHLNVSGYAYEILIRDIARATDLTMQCVNKSIKVLEEKNYLVIGIKEYGYLNYFIDRESSFSKDHNSGGYYQMDGSLLNHVLKIKTIDELRLVLISLMEDDFARKRKQKTILSYGDLRKIIPSSAHPKARSKITKHKANSPYKFKYREKGLVFILQDESYGKITAQRIKAEAEVMLSKLREKNKVFDPKSSSDIISLCLEHGTNRILNAIYCLDQDQLRDSSQIGLYIRNYLQAA